MAVRVPDAFFLLVLAMLGFASLAQAGAARPVAGARPEPFQANEPDYKLTASAGFAGQTRLGWVPVRVTIDARREFEGELVAVLRDPSAMGLTLYESRRRLKLPAGSKTEYRLHLRHDSPAMTPAAVDVWLEQNGRVKGAARNLNLALVSACDYLVCVVSNQSGVLSALKLGKTIPASANAPRQVERKFLVAQPEFSDLPERAADYKGVDFLVLYQTPFEQLSRDQKLAIRDHVWSGGVVVLCGKDAAFFKGPEIQGLVVVREVRATERAAADRLLRELGSRYGGWVVPDTSGVGVHEFALAGAAREESGFVLTPCGLGTVLLWRLAPEDPVVRHWPGTAEAFSKLGAVLYPGKPDRDTSGGDERTPLTAGRILAENLNLAQERGVPGVLMVFLVVLYLVLVGPVNYFLLRRLDMKALSIITIPLLAAIFVLINFAVGYLARGVVTSGRRVTVALAASGAERAEVLTYQSIFPASSMLADISTDGRGAMVGLSDSLSPSLTGGSRRQEPGFAVESDEQFCLSRYPLRMWEMFYFQAESMRPLGATLDKPGRIILTDLGNGRFTAVNAGGRPLKDCLVAALPDGRRYAWLGELPTGAARSGELANWKLETRGGNAFGIGPGGVKGELLPLRVALRLWLDNGLGVGQAFLPASPADRNVGPTYAMPEGKSGFAAQAAELLAGCSALEGARLERSGRMILLARTDSGEDLEPVRFEGASPRGEAVNVLVVVSGGALR